MENYNSYAVVTGGTSGIGYQLARLLAKDHYNLILVARHDTDLKRVAAELKEEFKVQVVTFAKDLFNPENAFALYDEISVKYPVKILINDAGQGQYGEFTDTDIRKELDIINLNIASVVVLTKKFLVDMVIAGEGKILNLSSIASKTPGPWQSVYHASKAFIQSFTEAIRSENKNTGVTITALLPGVTDTDFFNKADMLDSKAVQNKSDMADPADVAKDGYEALMSGKDMVVSGFKNKIQVAMANVTPDAKVADKLKKQQAPVTSK